MDIHRLEELPNRRPQRRRVACVLPRSRKQKGVFRETGAPASAVKVLRKALTLSPDHHEVLHELCLMQMDGPQRKRKGLLGRLRGK